ncbi:MAG: hypothetical protein IJD04_03060, partial [Desulfovibrionaceae bacterium]|nr:hypothetical protein [Desulfovibrionaceae bacterium]
MQGKYKLAFPSWVRAGNIADNAVYICAQWAALRDAAPSFYELRPEIGLCFFESVPCLDYGCNDLPLRLSGL